MRRGLVLFLSSGSCNTARARRPGLRHHKLMNDDGDPPRYSNIVAGGLRAVVQCYQIVLCVCVRAKRKRVFQDLLLASAVVVLRRESSLLSNIDSKAKGP